MFKKLCTLALHRLKFQFFLKFLTLLRVSQRPTSTSEESIGVQYKLHNNLLWRVLFTMLFMRKHKIKNWKTYKNYCNNKKQKSDFVKIKESKLQKNSKLFKERLLLIISNSYNVLNATSRKKNKTCLNSSKEIIFLDEGRFVLNICSEGRLKLNI